jgi:uncharacterized small protein (TIGR04563 family)
MPADNDFAAFMASHSTGKPSSTGGKRGRPANPNAAPLADRKTSVYFGSELIEIRETAARLDRSVSWVLKTAFNLAKDQLASMTVSDTE